MNCRVADSTSIAVNGRSCAKWLRSSSVITTPTASSFSSRSCFGCWPFGTLVLLMLCPTHKTSGTLRTPNCGTLSASATSRPSPTTSISSTRPPARIGARGADRRRRRVPTASAPSYHQRQFPRTDTRQSLVPSASVPSYRQRQPPRTISVSSLPSVSAPPCARRPTGRVDRGVGRPDGPAPPARGARRPGAAVA